jgi:hypothetical protein
MKKLLVEAFKIFWIPLIMAVVSYIFFTLKDVTLGIIVLVALSAAYTLIRLYVSYKKWWLLIILFVVLVASVGTFFLKAPTISLTINGEKVNGAQNNIGGSAILVTPAPANGLYTKGTVVTLTAKAGLGQDWKSWVGTDNDNTNPTTIKMDGKKQIRVNFESRFSLIINNQAVIGSLLHFTEGDITVSPAPDNDGKYTSGTTVSLSVRPNTGYDWKNWTGTSDDSTNPTTVVMAGGNKNVNVDFEGRFSLTINDHLVIGSSMNLGQGTVSFNPAPGDDGKYSYGTRITVTAIPDTGYGWKSWMGTSNDSANPVSVTINSDKHVAVSFEDRYLVMINNRVMTGAVIDFAGGTVSADPAPGEDARFTKNSLATLTAAPSAGYRFGEWSGDVTAKVPAVNIVLDKNKNYNIIFIKTFTLTTSANTTGGGSISPVDGIYDEGAQITLTATPAAGYRFGKWTGSITSTTASTLITFSDDVTATANFIKTYKLTISVDPAGGGFVTPDSGTYDEGTVVAITAMAADGYIFAGWDGLSDNATSQNVTLTGDMNIKAKFVLETTSSNTTSN